MSKPIDTGMGIRTGVINLHKIATHPHLQTFSSKHSHWASKNSQVRRKNPRRP